MIEQMIATIQVYIHCRTDKQVNITPNLPKDLPKLIEAYNTAKIWLSENTIN